MSETLSPTRGMRDTSWLVLRRGLAIVRRLMRGPATRDELMAAVLNDVGPDAYSARPDAARRALKNDRAVLRRNLGIEIDFDRRLAAYRLVSLGDTPWLDLGDEELVALATLYDTFADSGPEAERVCKFLDLIAGLLPLDRLEAMQRRRTVFSIELRELDETPVPPRVMGVVQRALAERHRLGFQYLAAAQDDRAPRYHEVEPYGIVFRRGHYYLEAYDLFSRSAEYGRVTQEQYRQFRMQGILDDDMLRVLPEKLPPGRRPQKRYAVRYRLAPPAVRHGISRHFADMQTELLPDGSAIVEATAPDPWDAVHTLLGYGESCVVLGGEEVLRIMRGRVVELAKRYDLLAFDPE